MWILLNKERVHGENTHLALDYEFRVCLTEPLVPTTQRLDWYDNINQKNTIVLVITTQEQTLIEKDFEKSILENSFCLRPN